MKRFFLVLLYLSIIYAVVVVAVWAMLTLNGRTISVKIPTMATLFPIVAFTCYRRASKGERK